jgi:hypothetical protein
MNVDKIEYHLEFYDQDDTQIEHYGNMGSAFIPPRKGEHVSLIGKQKTLEVTRVVHYIAEYQTPFSIGYVVRVYGKEVPFEGHA